MKDDSDMWLAPFNNAATPETGTWWFKPDVTVDGHVYDIVMVFRGGDNDSKYVSASFGPHSFVQRNDIWRGEFDTLAEAKLHVEAIYALAK